MDLVTHSILVLSAVAITLGLLYFRFWLDQKDRVDFLLFTVACFSTAVYAWFEMSIVNADSLDELSEVLYWSEIPSGLALISLAAFVSTYLNAGPKWLFWTIAGLRGSGMLLNLVGRPLLGINKASAMNYSTVLGERLTLPIIQARPFILLNAAALALFIVFCYASAFDIWRRRERGRASIFFVTISGFVVYGSVVGLFFGWSPVGLPMLASPGVIFIVMAIGYELNYELHSTAKLAKALELREGELRESVKQLKLSAEAADVGVWIRSADGELIWASDKWYDLFGIDRQRPLSLNAFLSILEPRYRKTIEETLTGKYDVGDEYEIEYPIKMKNGEVRWIRGTGRADLAQNGELVIRGAAVDITKLKLAQEAAHDLSRRLINAQEKERARLARELHDDLSQTLALLSIQLHSMANNTHDPESVSSKLGNITFQIERLSSDVHRISHELHPAKLEQLGLVSALRGFCREISSSHGLKVDFHEENIPRSLPNDVSLCLYRVAQESLQNVVKHSGASNVTVDLTFSDEQIRLSIADNGSGFDIAAEEEREGLGLISMKERLRTVGGMITIDSTVGSGTKVDITVPIGSTVKARRARGTIAVF